jgi:DNA excision repair protein ERCC-2
MGVRAMNLSSALRLFPYPSLRSGQAELIGAIHETVESGKHLCVEAVNGFGKTIAALYGVLPLVQTGKLAAIYVARTHKELDRVMDELRPISGSFDVNGIVMRGRKSSCLNPLVTRYTSSPLLAMFVCSQLKRAGRCQYYQNLLRQVDSDGRYALRICSTPLTGHQLRRECQRDKVCPYEVTKLVLSHMAVVATTYNQIFDSHSNSAFFEAFGRPLSRTVIILDEAHNLPRVGAELASARLSLQSVRQAISEAQDHGLPVLARCGSALEYVMQQHLHEANGSEVAINPVVFNDRLRDSAKVGSMPDLANDMLKAGDLLAKQMLMVGKPPVSYIHVLGVFLQQWYSWCNRPEVAAFLVQLKPEPTWTYLELVALDARLSTVPVLSSCHASVHLSGTLQPIQAHVDLVGLPKETQAVTLPSPFRLDQVLPLISLGVTTAMRHRSVEMFKRIARRIGEACQATPHNAGVFVPSYFVLQSLLEAGLQSLIDKELFVETPQLSSSENDVLVRGFKARADRGAVLLGVMGGRNSEGEDYPGREMETVVVVGVPYAQPTPRESIRIEYLERQFPNQGRLYGYVLPAMRSASQAAGRCVRRLDDQSVIVFLDDRYATSYCQRLLPSWIADRITCLENRDGSLLNRITSFYQSSQQSSQNQSVKSSH